MPPGTDQHNVYAAAGANMLADAVRTAKPLVYVPHTESGDLWEIDPTTTGSPGAPIRVTDPYNLYFTPDGRSAISVAERHKKLVFYDPTTWRVQDTLPTPECAGIDHADFTPDGRTAVFTCEFAGRVAVVDVATHQLLRMIDMPHRNTTMGPQDIKLAPDGSVFYIPDSEHGGVWVLDGAAHEGRAGDPHRNGRPRPLPLRPGTPPSSTSPTGTRAASACSTPTPAGL
jgi:DNA-binding beta-propeller fold protein YncE